MNIEIAKINASCINIRNNYNVNTHSGQREFNPWDKVSYVNIGCE